MVFAASGLGSKQGACGKPIVAGRHPCTRVYAVSIFLGPCRRQQNEPKAAMSGVGEVASDASCEPGSSELNCGIRVSRKTSWDHGCSESKSRPTTVLVSEPVRRPAQKQLQLSTVKPNGRGLHRQTPHLPRLITLSVLQLYLRQRLVWSPNEKSMASFARVSPSIANSVGARPFRVASLALPPVFCRCRSHELNAPARLLACCSPPRFALRRDQSI